MTIIGSFPNAVKNNLIPGGESAYGLLVEPLGETWTRVDFSFHAGLSADPNTDIYGSLTMSAGLIPRTGIAAPYTFQPRISFTADSGTNVITSSTHQLFDGNEVKVHNEGGTLPDPLVQGNSYFIRDKSGSTYKLASTIGGAAIDLTTDGTGTNYISNSIVSVEWDRENPRTTSLFGSVEETWRSYGIIENPGRVTGGRSNVDAGYIRPGPRYTMLFSGSECRGYVDYTATGGRPPRIIVPAPIGGFSFPQRLAMAVDMIGAASGTTGASINDIQIAGRLGQKTILSAANKAAWGVTTADLHLRIYQAGIVDGFPVDIDL